MGHTLCWAACMGISMIYTENQQGEQRHSSSPWRNLSLAGGSLTGKGPTVNCPLSDSRILTPSGIYCFYGLDRRRWGSVPQMVSREPSIPITLHQEHAAPLAFWNFILTYVPEFDRLSGEDISPFITDLLYG